MLLRCRMSGHLLTVTRYTCKVIYMSNADTTQIVHYDLTGNGYYGVPSTGFCTATTGAFTIARAEITCTDCLARVAA